MMYQVQSTFVACRVAQPKVGWVQNARIKVPGALQAPEFSLHLGGQMGNARLKVSFRLCLLHEDVLLLMTSCPNGCSL